MPDMVKMDCLQVTCIFLILHILPSDAQSTGALRIVSGTSRRGRIEIYRSGVWNTICDDSWDDTDATVACKQPGFKKGIGLQGGSVTDGSGNIAMDNVACSGSESQLQYCTHAGWNVHNCGHSEDAGVECSNICDSNPCLNAGTCNEYTSSYTCSCTAAYQGSRCENVKYCHSSPCLNSGTCSEVSGGFSCACLQAFLGSRCETQNYCGSSPCQNGATCSEATGTFSCACVQGYEGNQCQTANFCGSSPCKNGATCSEAPGGGFLCACAVGYTGTQCETEIDECASNPCPDHTCFDAIGAYYCRCDYSVSSSCEGRIFGQFTKVQANITSVSIQQREAVRPAICRESSCTILCQMKTACLAFKFEEKEDDCECTLISANVYRLPLVSKGDVIFILGGIKV